MPSHRMPLFLGCVAATLGLLSLPGIAQRAKACDRKVAVTFDDLPAVSTKRDLAVHAEITDKLLAALERHKVPAIGFVNESKLETDGVLDPKRATLLARWLDASHDLGNHSYSHPDLHRISLEAFQEDVLRGEAVTQRLLAKRGQTLTYFRHPFLHTGRDLETKRAFEAFLDRHGYRVAPVTIDNAEWIFARACDRAIDRGDLVMADRVADAYLTYMDRVFAYYEAQSRAFLGYELPQILLLHANRLNADTLDRLVGMMKERGYGFISLGEALRDKAHELPDTYTGPGGITWLHRWALTAGKRGEFFHGEPEVPDFVTRESGLEGR